MVVATSLDMPAVVSMPLSMSVRNGGFHHRFLHDLVIILYEMKEGDLEQDPDFWKRRHKYYVTTPENPVALD